MKKIKIISGESPGDLQDNIDKWVSKKKPFVVSVSAVTAMGDYDEYIVTILYAEDPLELL